VKGVLLHFACNDPDNGVFAGRVEGVALDNGALDLTCQAMRPPKLSVGVLTLKFGRRRWDYEHEVQWLGNWCWNGYWMSTDRAVDFLTWLHADGRFSCDGGWVELCDLWAEAPHNVAPERFRLCVAELAREIPA